MFREVLERYFCTPYRLFVKKGRSVKGCTIYRKKVCRGSIPVIKKFCSFFVVLDLNSELYVLTVWIDFV